MPLWQSLSQELFTRWRWVAVSCCISLLWSYNRNIEKECFCYMWNWVGHASLCSSFIVFAVLIFYFLWLSISRRLDDFLFSKLAFMETVGDSASLFKFIFSCKFHVMLAYFWLIDNFWRIGVTQTITDPCILSYKRHWFRTQPINNTLPIDLPADLYNCYSNHYLFVLLVACCKTGVLVCCEIRCLLLAQPLQLGN